MSIDKRLIIDLWHKGYNITEIGKHLGCTRQYASYILNENGIHPKKHYKMRLRKVETQSELVEMFRNGETYQSISDKTGIKLTTLYSYIARHVAREERRALKKPKADDVERLFFEGKRNRQISRELNIGEHYVSYVIKKRGLKSRKLALLPQYRLYYSDSDGKSVEVILRGVITADHIQSLIDYINKNRARLIEAQNTAAAESTK